MKKIITLAAIIAASSSLALPIDMHGEFQADSYRLQNFTKVENGITNSTGTGSQEVGLAAENKGNAVFQSYIFKLQPEIIINDSTTLKAELTSGYGYGGAFGRNSQQKETGTGTTFTSALYTQNTVTKDTLVLTQAYATFYADTATYTVGRHATHWGLGAIHNDGNATSSRHATIREGITADFKIGNFKISPYYSKISDSNLTDSGAVKESGLSLVYNNVDQDLTFGILYAINTAGNETGRKSDVGAALIDLKGSDVKITDIYFKKTIGVWTTEVEVPILTGDLGNVYAANSNVTYKAQAILVNNTFKISPIHTFNLNLGKVSGDDGSKSSFGAMFLNPNFQIANLLFRYNLAAIADNTQNIFDSYISNTFYVKGSHAYSTGRWTWTNSFIWAKAEETAKSGAEAYNHTTNKAFTAVTDQESDLGIEIDSNFSYDWNTAVTLGANIGYLLTGDYFAFNNTATPNTVKNAYSLSAFANIKF